LLQSTIPTLYIRLRRVVRVRRGKSVLLGDIAQYIAPPELEQALRQLVIYRPSRMDGNRVLIDMLMVIGKLRTISERLQIEHFGDPHALLIVETGRGKPNLLLALLVWLLLFVGSGLTIMNFHADVSMLEVHRRIYEMLTGKAVERPLLLQIPYSIGIGVGMIVFFNHLFKKRFNEEPSPLEVEMYMYQESLNAYVIAEEYGKQAGSREQQ